jgi:membrane-bound lytic murein transglycosylase D
MPATAKQYGIAGSESDFIKSSDAAARLLRDNINSTGDLKLGIAAYNTGAGNVRAAQRKSVEAGGGTSFEDIKKYLAKETREYVPKVLAERGVNQAVKVEVNNNTGGSAYVTAASLR